MSRTYPSGLEEAQSLLQLELDCEDRTHYALVEELWYTQQDLKEYRLLSWRYFRIALVVGAADLLLVFTITQL